MRNLPKNLILGFILCLLIVVTPVSVAFADTADGSDIDSVTTDVDIVEDEASAVYMGNIADGGWKLEDGVLAICASKMPDFKKGEAPWYKHADKIKEARILFTVENIGAYAFYGCDNLRTVEFGDAASLVGGQALLHRDQSCVTEIGRYAFAGCVNLETLNGFPVVETIGEYAFQDCVKLTGFNAALKIVLPETLGFIDAGAFYNCDSILELTLPENINCVGVGAFYSCDNLFRVICPASLENIEEVAFGRCYNIGEVELYNPNTVIEDKAFSHNGEWDILFMGYNDSTAEEYARENGHKFFDVEFEDTLKLSKKSVSLEDRFAINYYVESDLLEGCHGTYLHVEKYSVDAEGNKTYVDGELVEEYTTANIAGKTYYVFTYRNINAYELGSVLLTYIGTTEDEFDVVYWGDTEEYSVKQYAMTMLERTNDQKLKTLLVDMLNYGASAQIYFGYNTDNLVNADLTADQQAYATKEMKAVSNADDSIILKDPKVELIGRSLSLEDRVEINFYFDLKDYHADDVYAVITYIDCNGNKEKIIVDGKDFSGTDNRAKITLSSLNAREMRTQIEIEIYDAHTDNQISHSYLYSIQQYVASALGKNIDANIHAMLEAMIKFGDSAEAYFA